MDVIIPLLMARIIDEGITQSDMPAILQSGFLLLGAAAVSLAFGVLSGRFAATAAAGFAKNLRHDMFHKIQDFSFANIDKFSTASLVTRMTTDVSNLQNSFIMILRFAIRSPSMFIFAFIMAFQVHSELALVFLVSVPIIVIGLALMMTRAYPLFQKVFKAYDRMNNTVQEDLRGIRVVKSFNREEKEIGKFGEVSDGMYKTYSHAERLMAFAGPLMQVGTYLTSLLLSWFGAQYIVGESMSTGQLVSLMSYALQILISLMFLSMVFVMLTMSRAAAERVAEVLTEEPDIKDTENPLMAVRDGGISFKGVQFSYVRDLSKLCLRDIDLDIPSGTTVGIIGGTGSGKSTFVQLIPRLYDVTGGSLLVGGEDVRKYDLNALRDAVSMVLQKNELFSGTIRENLRWGNESATDEQIIHACKLAQAHDFVTAFPDGYDTVIEQGGTNVSGGQKQRLCIARALLKNPKILILDDSTSAVDTRTDARINQAFREEIPDVTKLIISQRISSVEHADMIIVMDDGGVTDIGTHDELIEKSEIYREVFESQKKGEDAA